MNEAFSFERLSDRNDYVIIYADERALGPQEICDALRDYYLSMEVLSQIVDLTFPDLEVPEPYMAGLKRKADDAIKRWRDRFGDKS